MAKQIDVYREWLGITDTARPLNYYQLLRLPQFDDNVSRVRANYRKMNAHVRKFATGEYAAESQALLNELAKAMLCLTDADRKREYDASLGRRDAAQGRRRTFEDILLANKVVNQEQLAKARSFADAVGLSIRDAVVQQKLASPDVVMMSYAESLGLPYIELEDVGVDEQMAACVPPDIARQHACVPVMVDQGFLMMASPNPIIPDVEEELRLRFNMPVRSVLCTAAGVNQAVAKYYPRGMVAAMPVTQAQPQAAAAQPAEAAKPAPAAQPALSPQEAKERLKSQVVIAATACGLTVALTIMLRMVLLRAPDNVVTLPRFFLHLGLGLVVGAIAYVVVYFRKP